MGGRIGQQLGNYRLLRLVGQGGFADVYLGEHIHLGTQAAIKVMQMRLVQNNVQNFLNEARTIAHLVHPYIIRVLDFGVEDNVPYLVMDYAPKGTFRQRFLQGKPLPPAPLIPYIKQTAAALQYGHDKKLIHRDVKPENMLLGPNDEVLLSDFGLALIAHNSISRSPTEAAGTAAYMAPEQLQGKPRPASDQYSLATIAYEWLTGQCPFQGSFFEIASQQIVAPIPPLREKVPTIPAGIEQVVLKALDKDPKLRYPSVRDFALALEEACLIARQYSFDMQATEPAQDPSAILNGNKPLKSTIYPTASFDNAMGTNSSPDMSVSSGANTSFKKPVEKFFANQEPETPQLTPAIQAGNDFKSQTPTSNQPIPQPDARAQMPQSARLESKPLSHAETVMYARHLSQAEHYTIPSPPNSQVHPPFPATQLPETPPMNTRDRMVPGQEIQPAIQSTIGTATNRSSISKKRGPNIYKLLLVIVVVLVIIGAIATLVLNTHMGISSSTNTGNVQATVTTHVGTTPTSQVNANPYLASQKTLVLNDPLISNEHGWQTGTSTSTSGSCQFATNGYQVSATMTIPPAICLTDTENYTNFTYQADMNFTSVALDYSGAGLVFRANPSTNQYYYFEIFRSGRYNLDVCSTSTSCTPLAGQPNDNRVLPSFQQGEGVTNTLAVVAQNNSFKLYVNKQLVTQVSDTNNTLNSGNIGVMATAGYDTTTGESQPTVVVFQNIKVWK
ncbi:MAG TPA: serine/threonine-protein kinase [Dictyobacter sp.]|jgi:serine/threonine protein kinase|nr:serine/threonine-protein kinase [Dictyobacter sp.]